MGSSHIASMVKNEKLLSVVVPIFNEEGNLDTMHARLTQALSNVAWNYEILFVDDGSRDGSRQKIRELADRDPHVYYIYFSRNFGHQIAVTAGLDAVRGQAVVIIDGDLQDPPELIPQLLGKYGEGYDVVYARRRSREGETAFKKFTARMFYRTLKRITSIDIPLDTGDFRLIDRKVVEYLKRMPEQNKFLRGQIAWLGFRQAEVLFQRDKRMHGKSGYTLGKMFRFAMDGITGFSDLPLHFLVRIGFLMAVVSFLVILFALYMHFILQRTITGWTSLIITSTFIGGVQLLSIGIIGEYLSRINRDVRKRPLYIVERTNCGPAANGEDFDGAGSTDPHAPRRG